MITAAATTVERPPVRRENAGHIAEANPRSRRNVLADMPVHSAPRRAAKRPPGPNVDTSTRWALAVETPSLREIGRAGLVELVPPPPVLGGVAEVGHRREADAGRPDPADERLERLIVQGQDGTPCSPQTGSARRPDALGSRKELALVLPDALRPTGRALRSPGFQTVTERIDSP